MEERLLEVKNLKVSFNVGKKKLTAVENVEFSLDKGKVIGIVGESGCGKSVTATSILRLVPPAVSIIDEDSQILFDGEDLVKAPEARMREIRGNEISMIFQEPMSSLNPVYRIGDQMLEMIRTHNKQISKKDALDQCVEMLKRVGIPSPEQRIKEFPHQLSGGMRQRVMIAMALLCNPKLLIADEPTTALDVTIQAQILRIIKTLTKESNTSVILITHDKAEMRRILDAVKAVAAEEVGKIISDRRIRVGIGTIEGGIKGIRHTYSNAQDAVKAGEIFKKDRVILEYMGMEIYSSINQMVVNFGDRLTRTVLRQLGETEKRVLSKYYKCKEDVALTAEELGMTQEEVKNSLAQVKVNTGLDVNDTEDNFKLHFITIAKKVLENDERIRRNR